MPKGITPVEKMAINDMMIFEIRAREVLIVETPAEKFIREFPEKFPEEYRKFKIIVGITKDEPERYVEEQLNNTLMYARREQISPERVCELLQKLKEMNESDRLHCYDLYTITDGELVHVFSGGERDTYNLCENGLIANEGADGYAMSVFAYYSFEGTELHLVEAVIYNGWDDSENPWFYSTQSDNMYDTENMDSISEEQAWATMEKYVFEHPTYIPFVEE